MDSYPARPGGIDPAALSRLAAELLATHGARRRIEHDYVLCDARDFGYLDLRRYEQTARTLDSCAFTPLGCLFDRAGPWSGSLKPSINQVALSPDGAIYADILHAVVSSSNAAGALLRPRPKPCRIISLHTELSDEVHVLTSTSREWEPLPGVIVETLPESAELTAVLEAHWRTIDDYLEEHPGVAPVVLHDLGEVLAADRLLEHHYAQARQEQQRLTVDRLMAMGCPEHTAWQLMAEIRQLVASQPAPTPAADAPAPAALPQVPWPRA